MINIVEINSNKYKERLLIRELLFFKDFSNAEELLIDLFEKDSIHVVSIINNKVIGTGRLTVVKGKAIISQMTVLPDYQNKGIGKAILHFLIKKSTDFEISNIELSARITALEFYKKYNFREVDVIYPSKKTGVLHQKMILEIGR